MIIIITITITLTHFAEKLGLSLKAWEPVQQLLDSYGDRIQIEWLALDLISAERSRTKVYLRFHDATPDELEQAARIAAACEPDDIPLTSLSPPPGYPITIRIITIISFTYPHHHQNLSIPSPSPSPSPPPHHPHFHRYHKLPHHHHLHHHHHQSNPLHFLQVKQLCGHFCEGVSLFQGLPSKDITCGCIITYVFSQQDAEVGVGWVITW